MKPNILIVTPYGIGLRDTLLNKDFHQYLTNQFNIDVLSPFHIKDPVEKWGIRNTFPMNPKGILSRIFGLFNSYANTIHMRLIYKEFYRKSNWLDVYEILLGYDERRIRKTPHYEKWDLVAKTPIGYLARKVLSHFPFKYPPASILNEHQYKFVLVDSPTDANCNIMAMAAKKKRIPVVCRPMGLDNFFSGGPMVMNPDLFLLWGREQKEQLENKLAQANDNFKTAQYRSIGPLSHDFIYGHADPINTFESFYPEIDTSKMVITFAAYSKQGDPGQLETCKTILNFFTDNRINGHLIVRHRPSVDKDIWESFAKENPETVTIQVPEGASYAKRFGGITVNRDAEIGQINLYSATLHRSDLVITGGFSTVFLDSFAAGTPAIATALSSISSNDKFLSKAYEVYGKHLNSIASAGIISTKEVLKANLEKFIRVGGAETQMEKCRNVYDEIAGTLDCKSGQRASQAIIGLLNQH